MFERTADYEELIIFATFVWLVLRTPLIQDIQNTDCYIV